MCRVEEADHMTLSVSGLRTARCLTGSLTVGVVSGIAMSSIVVGSTSRPTINRNYWDGSDGSKDSS